MNLLFPLFQFSWGKLSWTFKFVSFHELASSNKRYVFPTLHLQLQRNERISNPGQTLHYDFT